MGVIDFLASCKKIYQGMQESLKISIGTISRSVMAVCLGRRRQLRSFSATLRQTDGYIINGGQSFIDKHENHCAWPML